MTHKTLVTCLSFPGGSDGKESTCNAGDLGSIPGLGRSPGEGNSYPIQYSGLENSMDYIVHGVSKSWTWLSNFHFPLQKLQVKALFLEHWLNPTRNQRAREPAEAVLRGHFPALASRTGEEKEGKLIQHRLWWVIASSHSHPRILGFWNFSGQTNSLGITRWFLIQ